jgi:pimeloyl-ACP methyl ester carboxylesterase
MRESVRPCKTSQRHERNRAAVVSQSSLVDNARIFKVSFAAAPPPKVTCELLGQIKAPVEIVRGEDTRAFYRIASDTAHRCMPGSRLVVIPRTRHLWPAQEPAAFDAALLGFLKG